MERPRSFGPEPELELLCSTVWLPHRDAQTAHFERVRELCGRNLDWERFAALVDRHHVNVLTHAVLTRSGAVVPASVAERLRQRACMERMHALYRMSELRRVTAVLAEHGIETIVLKGAIVSQQLYADPTLRMSIDIDVMVRPEQFRLAHERVLTCGYACVVPGRISFTDRQWRAMSRFPNEFVYVHRENGVRFELHRDPGLWTHTQIEELWNRRTAVSLGESRYQSIEPEMLLLMLCDHGARHEWSHLKWLGDVARLLSAPSRLDMRLLVDLAERVDARRPLAQAALLSHWLCGTTLPPGLVEVIAADRIVGWLAHRALAAIMRQSHGLLHLSLREIVARELYWFSLKQELSIAEFLRYRSIAPREWGELGLPDWLLPLCGVLRPALALRRRVEHRRARARSQGSRSRPW